MNSEVGGTGKPDGAMDDVLSSIKQIIDEDKASHAPAGASESLDDEEVLELTELEEDESEEATPIAFVFEKRASTAGAPPTLDTKSDEAARSNPAVVAQLKGLREAAKIAKDISGDAPSNSRFEPYVMKAIEPMLEKWTQENLPRLAETRVDAAVQRALKDWMDRNLEAVVERVVREEVSRMVAQASED